MEAIVSQRIKALRAHFKISQNDLANKIESTVQSVSRWENGVSEPNKTTLITISQIFGVSHQWLKGEDSEMFVPGVKNDIEVKTHVSWKEEAYNNLKEMNDYLKSEIEFYKTLVSNLTKQTSANFNPGTDLLGIFGNENTGSTVRVAA